MFLIRDALVEQPFHGYPKFHKESHLRAYGDIFGTPSGTQNSLLGGSLIAGFLAGSARFFPHNHSVHNSITMSCKHVQPCLLIMSTSLNPIVLEKNKTHN